MQRHAPRSSRRRDTPRVDLKGRRSVEGCRGGTTGVGAWSGDSMRFRDRRERGAPTRSAASGAGAARSGRARPAARRRAGRIRDRAHDRRTARRARRSQGRRAAAQGIRDRRRCRGRRDDSRRGRRCGWSVCRRSASSNWRPTSGATGATCALVPRRPGTAGPDRPRRRARRRRPRDRCHGRGRDRRRPIAGARRVVLAAPVSAADTASRLSAKADVVCLVAPARFSAVGEWYEDFDQTTDSRGARSARPSAQKVRR